MGDWDVVSTEPAGDPWAVVKTEPSSSLMQAAADKLGTVISNDPSTGGAEMLTSALTGILSQIPAGLAGLGAGGANELADALGAKEPFDPAANVVESVRNKLTYRPHSASGQAGVAELADLVNRIKSNKVVQKVGDVAGEAADKTGFGNEIRSFGPAALDAATQLIPLVKGLGAASELGSAAANTAEQAAKTVPDWQTLGLRDAESHPIARGVAGSSGKEALTIHNQKIGNVALQSEAGVSPHVDVSYEALKAARAAPGSVYDRVGKALPEGPLSQDAQAAIERAGTDDLVTHTPDAQAILDTQKARLLSKPMTGKEVVDNLRALRQEGYARIGTGDVEQKNLGRAQLDMAKALETHINDTLPPNSDVSLAQLSDARKTIAKNYAVQGALRGKDIDLQAIARMQRADPDLLTGHMKTVADFANENIPITGLASRIYSPPGLLEDTISSHRDVLTPGFWAQALGGAKARNVLTGDTEEALARLKARLPQDPGKRFAPIPGPPEPSFGGYLPSPDMVNAGSGATTPTNLGALGLTSDIQHAGPAHPGFPREAPVPESPSSPPMDVVDFLGAQKWGDFSLTPDHPSPLHSPDTVPYEDVLEQGGTQRAPVGLPGITYRPPSKSPKSAQMRTPSGAPELTEELPTGPSPAQLAFRTKQSIDRLRRLSGDLTMEGPGSAAGTQGERALEALKRHASKFGSDRDLAAAINLLRELQGESDLLKPLE